MVTRPDQVHMHDLEMQIEQALLATLKNGDEIYSEITYELGVMHCILPAKPLKPQITISYYA